MKEFTKEEAQHTIEIMSETQFEEFLSLLPEEITEEEKQIMRTHRAWVKFFTDVAYHRAVKEAFKEVVATQIWKEANT
jgi:hypothetical protein